MARLDDIREYWDEDSLTYDDAPTHRPRTWAERSAWAASLESLLPPPPADVLDVGAGTGFLSLIAARLGHNVTAMDISPGMLERLRRGASDETLRVDAIVGDATEVSGSFDAILERHLLWTLEDPVAALRSWRAAAPGGRLVLIESVWGTADPTETLRAAARDVVRRALGRRPDHHASYPASVRRNLPLGSGPHPSEVAELAMQAGWPEPRLVRLRDVEWASRLALHPLERPFGVTPRYAVVAG